MFVTNTWQAQAYITGQHTYTMDLTGTLCNGVHLIQVAQDWIKPNRMLLWTQQWTMKFCKSTELFHYLSNDKFFTEPASWSYSVSQSVGQSILKFRYWMHLSTVMMKVKLEFYDGEGKVCKHTMWRLLSVEENVVSYVKQVNGLQR